VATKVWEEYWNLLMEVAGWRLALGLRYCVKNVSTVD
jgi:hypothetical protein